MIEAFSEPVSGQMWVRAVCSAEYMDSKGENQKVELVHWITELTDQQAGQLVNDEDMAKLEAEQVLATAEDAAKYAGVDAETLQQWVENGLLTTEDGGFLKYNLDVFIESKGEPSAAGQGQAGGIDPGTGDGLRERCRKSWPKRRGGCLRRSSTRSLSSSRNSRRWTSARSWNCSRQRQK